jgi:glc operon protein GlcG
MHLSLQLQGAPIKDHLDGESPKGGNDMSYLRNAVSGAALAAMMMAGPGLSQTVDKKALTLEGAKKVIAAAVADAKSKNAPGAAIAVVDDGGNIVSVERLEGTFAAGANISIGKARTAALFQRPTKAFEDIINKGRTTMVALSDFTPLQGGVPIVVDHQVIGAVGVSGAASAQQDEEIAIAGAQALQVPHENFAAAQPVVYINSKNVAQAFSRGAVLVGEEEHRMHARRNYMVHASRRDAPGVGEVHVRDTDIIYVLAGSATFVTGGALVDGKTVAPDEIRGPSIRGGEGRRIAKGDVIVVPEGTPHWFKEVQAPFEYYVVKVR